MDVAFQHKTRVYVLWNELQSEMKKWQSNLPSGYVKEKTQISDELSKMSASIKKLEGICATPSLLIGRNTFEIRKD